MSDNDHKLDEFEILLQKMFDEGLSDDEKSELQKIISESSRKRQYYLDYCQVHAGLSEQGGLLTGFQPKTAVTGSGLLKPKKIIWLMAAAAAIVFFSVISFLNRKPDIETPMAFYRGKNLAVLDNSLGGVFSYGGRDGAELKKGNEMPAGVYHLKKGVIKVDFPNKASLIIESPCEFELISGKQVECLRGKMSAYVPKSARNFTISSSGVDIVDLGTEFSVYAEPGEFVETHVFKGEVEVVCYYEVGEKKRTVSEGQAVKVLLDASGPVLAGIDLKNDFFIRQLSEPDSVYSQKILKHNPVVYFPMDISEDQNSLHDLSKYKNDAVLVNPLGRSNFWRAGKIGTSLKFTGSSRDFYCYVPDYPKSITANLTVAGWVYADSRPVWATIMKNWGNSVYGQFHFGLDTRGFLDVEILDKNSVKIHTTDSGKIPIKEWVHVAFVHDGSTVKIYRNGRVVAENRVEGIKFPSDLQKLGIGSKLGDEEKAPAPGTPGHWDGRLDELAIFNKALTDDEIKELFESAK